MPVPNTRSATLLAGGKRKGMVMQATQPKLVTVAPDLVVEDLRKSVDHYTKVLGFESAGIFEMNGEAVHAEVFVGTVRLMFGPRKMARGVLQSKLAKGVAVGAGVVLYVGLTEGIDAYYAQVRELGAHVVDEITDQFWGDRTFMVEDPDGYLITFSQHVKDFPPEMLGLVKTE